MAFESTPESTSASTPDRSVGVLLVDDQPLVRRGLRTLLDLESDLRVVAEAADGVDALGLDVLTRVDVALVDAQMPRMDGVELIGHLKERHPGIACVILTTFDDEAILARALSAGARGHLLKDIEPEELVAAVRHAHAGRSVLGSMATDILVSRYLAQPAATPSRATDLAALSARERVVARHVARGATNREIARLMFISEGTVKNHVSAVLRKLVLRDRTALAIALNE
jgi:DNA-binding NarL/FixJ family response regulator